MHTACALRTSTNCLIVKTGPIGLANIGWRLYIVYIVFTFINLPAGEYQEPISSTTLTCSVWFLYPETQGLTLEQIDGLFIKDHAAVFDTLDGNGNTIADEKSHSTVQATHVA